MPKPQPVLDLDEYVVERLSVESNPSFSMEKDVDCELKILPEIAQHAEVDTLFKVGIDIRVRGNSRRNAPYSISLRILGFFRFADKTSVETRRKMLATNALPILYGVARGVVAQLTAQCVSGKYILPTINFVELIRSAGEQAAITAADN